MSYTTIAGNYLTDGNGGLFAYQNGGISNFPYQNKQNTTINQGVGSYTLWGGKDYNSAYSGNYTSNISDLTAAYGQYGPQSWRISSTTTAVFYTGKNYTGNSRTYGPGSSETDTFSTLPGGGANPSPFLSVAVSSPSYSYQKVQQVGTIDANGVNQFWKFADVQANMLSLVDAAQAANQISSSTTAAKLYSAVNALSCNTFFLSITPSLPQNFCVATTTTTAKTNSTTTTTKQATTTSTLSNNLIYIIIAIVVVLITAIFFLMRRRNKALETLMHEDANYVSSERLAAT